MSTERSPLLPTHNSAASRDARASAFALTPALAALRAGKLPSQTQLDKLLHAALESDVLAPGIGRAGSRTGRLSEEGARVVKALRKVLEAAGRLGNDKNEPNDGVSDDKIQTFLYHLTSISTPSTTATLGPSSSATLFARREQAALSKEVAADTEAVLSSLKDVCVLLLTSPRFRTVLSQAVGLAAGIVADASQKVAEGASELEGKARETAEDDKPLDVASAKTTGKKAVRGLATGRIQGEAKEAAVVQLEQLGQYFEETVGGEDEVRDRLFEQLNAVVKEVQGDKAYQQAVETVLRIIKKYGAKAAALAERAKDKAEEEADQEPLDKALTEAKAIAEAFAGGESLDPVLEAAGTLRDDVQSDDQVEAYFKDVGSFLEASLKVEGYATSQRAYRRSSALYQRGQDLLAANAGYQADLQRLVDSLEAFVGAVGDDEAFGELGRAVEDLGIELEHAGKTGLNALRAGSLGLGRDLVDVVLPRLVGLVKEIPIPRTEFQSAAVDFAIDDATFESASFIPDNIRVVNRNDLLLTQGYACYAADLDSSVRLHVDGLRLHAKEIAYWFHRKGGFLTAFEDEGLLEVAFDRKGLAFDVTLENATEENRESFFVVKDVKVDISDLQYHISRNSSWLLYFSKPFVSGLVKRSLKESLEHSIVEYLKQADLALYGLQNRAIAASNAKPSPKDFLTAVFSTSVFGASSSAKLTQQGIVKYGRRGDYLLAIGADESIFPGKAQSEAGKRRKEALASAKGVVGQAGEVAERGRIAKDQAKVDAEREVGKLGLEVQKKTKEEDRDDDGWRSAAFDL